ncbi:MAG: Hsp20/alpha crystallin family protein [Rubrivivax sp.]|nr:MAG: Hsp20/alpha crystallin family protein [Rubrivivax sp.]
MYPSLQSFPSGVFGDFERLRRELDDVFGLGSAPTSIRSAGPGAFPAINVGHTPASVEVYAFAPGIDPDQIEVTLDRGVLTLSGERPATLPEGNDSTPQVSVYSRERLSGRFKRAVSLPDDVDPERVQARYRDGVLHISVARREAAQPKRITIQ